MTMTYLMLLDFRGVKESKTIKDKLVNQMNTQWREADSQCGLKSVAS